MMSYESKSICALCNKYSVSKRHKHDDDLENASFVFVNNSSKYCNSCYKYKVLPWRKKVWNKKQKIFFQKRICWKFFIFHHAKNSKQRKYETDSHPQQPPKKKQKKQTTINPTVTVSNINVQTSTTNSHTQTPNSNLDYDSLLEHVLKLNKGANQGNLVPVAHFRLFFLLSYPK